MSAQEILKEFAELVSIKEQRKFAKKHGLPDVEKYKGAIGKKRLARDFPMYIGKSLATISFGVISTPCISTSTLNRNLIYLSMQCHSS